MKLVAPPIMDNVFSNVIPDSPQTWCLFRRDRNPNKENPMASVTMLKRTAVFASSCFWPRVLIISIFFACSGAFLAAEIFIVSGASRWLIPRVDLVSLRCHKPKDGRLSDQSHLMPTMVQGHGIAVRETNQGQQDGRCCPSRCKLC